MDLVLSALLLVCSALVAADHMKFKQDIEFCKAQYPGVAESTMMNLHRQGVLADETDENARCNLECMMTRVGNLVDASGKFDVAASKKNILQFGCVFFGPPGTAAPPQSAVDTSVDLCASLTGEGKCMTNYKIWACLYAKLHAATGKTGQ